MTELSRLQKDAIMKAIGMDGLDQESKDILLGLLNDNKTENITPKLFVDGAADLHSKTAGIGGVVYINDLEVSKFSEPSTVKNLPPRLSTCSFEAILTSVANTIAPILFAVAIA